MSNDSSNTEKRSPKQWGIVAILLGVVAFVGSQVFVAAIFFMFHGDPKSTGAQFFLRGASSIVLLGLLTLILRRYHATFVQLGLEKFKTKYIGFALLSLPVYMVMVEVGARVFKSVFPHIRLDQAQELGFQKLHNFPEMVMGFIALVILPPIVEEILFRGLIFRGLIKYAHPIVAAIVTSALFGIAHGQWNVGIDTFSLSLVLCFLAYRTESLWPSILLHAFKNGIAFIYVFLIGIR